MNPPPLPKPQPSAAHQCAKCSLVAPLIAILLSAAIRAAFTPVPPVVLIVSGLLAILFFIIGFITAIIGLCGIRESGSRGLLGRGIAGLLINGLFLIFCSLAAINGFQKAVTSRQLVTDLHTDTQELQANAKQSYNPKTGITNIDFKSLDRLQSDFNTAAQTTSGDDALVFQALSRYTAQMRSDLEKYHEAAAQLRTGHILTTSNLTDKTQIESRRELVQNFLTANQDLMHTTTNSADSIREDLENLKIPPAKIDSLMVRFNAKFAPRRDLEMQIRVCDDHIGQSMLTILDLLESDWGRWHYNAVNRKIYFNNPASLETYQNSLEAIHIAGKEQVMFQGQMVNLP